MDYPLTELAALFDRLAAADDNAAGEAEFLSDSRFFLGRSAGFRCAAEWCRAELSGPCIEVVAAGGPAGEG